MRVFDQFAFQAISTEWWTPWFDEFSFDSDSISHSKAQFFEKYYERFWKNETNVDGIFCCGRISSLINWICRLNCLNLDGNWKFWRFFTKSIEWRIFFTKFPSRSIFLWFIFHPKAIRRPFQFIVKTEWKEKMKVQPIQSRSILYLNLMTCLFISVDNVRRYQTSL